MKSREIRDYSGALIAISKYSCFCPRIGFFDFDQNRVKSALLHPASING